MSLFSLIKSQGYSRFFPRMLHFSSSSSHCHPSSLNLYKILKYSPNIRSPSDFLCCIECYVTWSHLFTKLPFCSPRWCPGRRGLKPLLSLALKMPHDIIPRLSFLSKPNDKLQQLPNSRSAASVKPQKWAALLTLYALAWQPPVCILLASTWRSEWRGTGFPSVAGLLCFSICFFPKP